MNNEYEQQAEDFLKETGVTLTLDEDVEFRPYAEGDKEFRNVYTVYLKRGDQTLSFPFGQSLADSNINPAKRIAPSPYAILASLDGYFPDTFEEFCLNYGYNDDSISDLALFKRCKEIADKNADFFTPDELEKLDGIQ